MNSTRDSEALINIAMALLVDAREAINMMKMLIPFASIVIPITINSGSILLVKITHFCVVSFVKGATIYFNLRLEFNYFPYAKFRSQT